MSKAKFSLRLEHIKRIRFIRNEIKKKLIKSISVNNNIKNSLRFYGVTLKRKPMNIYKITNQHKICLLRSRHRGVFRQFSMSRHTLKALNYEARIQNIKTISW